MMIIQDKNCGKLKYVIEIYNHKFCGLLCNSYIMQGSRTSPTYHRASNHDHDKCEITADERYL